MSNERDPMAVLEEAFANMDKGIDEVDPGFLPTRCAKCITSTICTPLTTYIGLLRVGIRIQVESCRYYAPIPKGEDNE